VGDEDIVLAFVHRVGNDHIYSILNRFSIMDLKGLYQIAKKELMPLYDGEPVDLRLEQVERSEDTGHWNIVVSYLVENKNRSTVNLIASLPYERVYKLLIVNDSNEVEELRIFNRAS
jgi:hypothetical protein